MENQTNAKTSIEDKANNWDKILDEYETSLGLPSTQPSHEEVKTYLSYTRQQLEALSPTDCAEVAYVLSQYILFLQREYNKHLARISWANSNIKNIIADKLKQYKGSYSQQESQAIKENDAARKLSELVLRAQGRADRLQFIANSVKNIRDDVKNLQYVKAGAKNE